MEHGAPYRPYRGRHHWLPTNANTAWQHNDKIPKQHNHHQNPGPTVAYRSMVAWQPNSMVAMTPTNMQQHTDNNMVAKHYDGHIVASVGSRGNAWSSMTRYRCSHTTVTRHHESDELSWTWKKALFLLILAQVVLVVVLVEWQFGDILHYVTTGMTQTQQLPKPARVRTMRDISIYPPTDFLGSLIRDGPRPGPVGGPARPVVTPTVNLSTVAIGLAITSKRLHQDVKKWPFFQTLLPSFCETASVGFSYHFFLAYDYTDRLFRSTASVTLGFTHHFTNTTLHRCPRQSEYSLHFVQCSHHGNPAQAQNDAMMAAYMLNMAFYYRINDDTIMKTKGWTEIFIKALKDYDPEYVGVVGPNHKNGNIRILTYDFVHVSHVNLFGFYYPHVFTDWYADSWISEVYKPGRVTKVQSVELVHTLAMGQRYLVRSMPRTQLKPAVRKGQEAVKQYVRSILRNQANRVTSDPKKVIAMTLYGSDPQYTYGAIRNAQLMPVHFPGWTLHVYIVDVDTSQGDIMSSHLRDEDDDPDQQEIIENKKNNNLEEGDGYIMENSFKGGEYSSNGAIVNTQNTVEHGDLNAHGKDHNSANEIGMNGVSLKHNAVHLKVEKRIDNYVNKREGISVFSGDIAKYMRNKRMKRDIASNSNLENHGLDVSIKNSIPKSETVNSIRYNRYSNNLVSNSIISTNSAQNPKQEVTLASVAQTHHIAAKNHANSAIYNGVYNVTLRSNHIDNPVSDTDPTGLSTTHSDHSTGKTRYSGVPNTKSAELVGVKSSSAGNDTTVIQEPKSQYHHYHVPALVVNKLLTLGARVMHVPREAVHVLHPAMWRYLAADAGTTHLLVRDARHRLSHRDKSVVDLWLSNASLPDVMCVRETPAPAGQDSVLPPGGYIALRGGGGRGGLLPQSVLHYGRLWYERHNSTLTERDFLNLVLLEQQQVDVVCYDSVTCNTQPQSVPFPAAAVRSPTPYSSYRDFIGQVYNIYDEPQRIHHPREECIEDYNEEP